MTKQVETTQATDSPWAAIQAATTKQERYAASQAALATWRVTPFGLPIPAFAQDLPMAADNDDAVEDILIGLLTADNIAEVTELDKLPGAEDYIGVPLAVSRIAWKMSRLEEATGWGMYVLLELQLLDGEIVAISTGAREVITTLYRCYMEGLFPVPGRFVLKGTKREGRNQPVGFRVEPKF